MNKWVRDHLGDKFKFAPPSCVFPYCILSTALSKIESYVHQTSVNTRQQSATHQVTEPCSLDNDNAADFCNLWWRNRDFGSRELLLQSCQLPTVSLLNAVQLAKDSTNRKSGRLSFCD